ETNGHNIVCVPNLNGSHFIRFISFSLVLLSLKITRNIDIFHGYLGARNLLMPLALFGLKIIYEITSPDVADSFVKNYAKRKVLYHRLFKINCVSKSVYLRVRSTIKDSNVYNALTYIER